MDALERGFCDTVGILPLDRRVRTEGMTQSPSGDSSTGPSPMCRCLLLIATQSSDPHRSRHRQPEGLAVLKSRPSVPDACPLLAESLSPDAARLNAALLFRDLDAWGRTARCAEHEQRQANKGSNQGSYWPQGHSRHSIT